MNESNNFALVPRPPGALEKAEPGAKRILSGMVADTLALVKKEPRRNTRPLRIVAMNDNLGLEPFTSLETMIRHCYKDATLLLFENPSQAWPELSRTDPDLLITAVTMAGFRRGKVIVQSLIDRKVTYPIVVMSPFETEELWVREFASRGLNVSFLPMPFTLEILRKVLDAALKIPRNTVEDPVEIAPQPLRTRPLRIVLVNDEKAVLHLMEISIRKRCFKDAKLLVFQDSIEAWQDLSQSEPDLLIIDDVMPGLRGEEIVRRLLDKKVGYPIIVTTCLPATEQWVQEYASRGLNITSQWVPFNLATFRKALENSLKSRGIRFDAPAEITPKSRDERRLRVVVLDDEEGPRRTCVANLKGWYHGVEILEFEDARDAWRELSRTDPDLFITDIQHVGISCKEMLTRLAEKKVKYPVLVISAVLGAYEDRGEPVRVQDVKRDWRPNLNVSFLPKPYTVDDFWTSVETALQIPARRAP